MNEEIEMIDLDMSDFTPLGEKRGKIKYSFPVITVRSNGYAYSNAAAGGIMPDYFKWFVNDEWCVLKACAKGTPRSYKTTRHKKWKNLYFRIPQEIGDLPICGNHKLYKTKDGVAFKKHEFVGEETK